MSPHKPFVFINTAVTADGKIDTANRHGAPISSPADLERVDRLRAESDAVMVGGRTLLSEDPKLTVKSPALRAARVGRGLPDNPMKVGVVSKLAPGESTLRSDGKFLTFGTARVALFTTARSDPAELARVRDAGAEVFVVGEERVDLGAALSVLADLGVKRLMVEGGGTLNAALLTAGLVDEVHLYIAPLIFTGAGAPTLADGPGLSRETAISLRLLDMERLDDNGFVVRYGVDNK